jgi:hypothetical protein
MEFSTDIPLLPARCAPALGCVLAPAPSRPRDGRGTRARPQRDGGRLGRRTAQGGASHRTGGGRSPPARVGGATATARGSRPAPGARLPPLAREARGWQALALRRLGALRPPRPGCPRSAAFGGQARPGA